ncbi:alkaline phosphatase family protein [Chlamydiota bacterium]
MSKKVLLIGLDGGTWKVFNSLIKEGKMVCLNQIVNSGCSGNLTSTIPPITPSAWTSFLTGINPGKHGIFDFFNFDKESFCTHTINAKSIKNKTLFDFMSENNKSVLFHKIPITYPPRKVNGVMLSCFMTPNLDVDFTYPPELKKEILTQFPDYQISPAKILYENNPFSGGFDKYLNKMENFLQQNKEIAFFLMKKYPADLCAIQFQSLDILQHSLWPYLDENHPLFNKEKYLKIISKYFETLDDSIKQLKRLFETLYSDCERLIIILSDHGFTRIDRFFNIQKWLIKKGLTFTKRRNIKTFLINNLIKIDKFNIRRKLISSKKYLNLLGDHYLSQIDSKRSSVCAIGNGWGNIFILIKDKESIMKYIRDELIKMRDPTTGRKVIKEVYFKKDVYHGTNIKNLPDVIAEPMPGYVIRTNLRLKEFGFIEVVNDTHLATHDLNGIIVFEGTSVVNSSEKINAKIYDITPTILYFLGLQIPHYFDGTVLKTIFKKSFTENYSVRYCAASESSERLDEEISLDLPEETLLVEKLKDLGYL